MRANVAHRFCMSDRTRPPPTVGLKCPWGQSTAANFPLRPSGRYRLPVTKKPGSDSKATFSTLYPSCLRSEWRMILSGQRAGSGVRFA